MNSSREQPLLLESICLNNGECPLLSFHQERVNKTRLQVLGIKRRLPLSAFLAGESLPDTGRHKIRLLYASKITSFTCTPYRIRPLETLRLVEISDGIDYRFKFADRTALDDAFSRREGCDDVLITWRGYLTDASYANIALYDGQKWYTPVHPLLKGVRRAALIKTGDLHPTVIRANDLKYFREVRLINAMMDLDESPSIPIRHIFEPGVRV